MTADANARISPGPSPVAGEIRSEATGRPLIDGAALFRGRTEVAIRFGDSIYRLRITRQGKLILNK